MPLLLRKYAIWLLIPLGVTLYACNGSKAFTKKGQKLEEAGLQQEAANMYYTALRKKQSNVDAQIGMKKTGQAVLGEMLNNFTKSRMSGNHKEAVYAYLDAEQYYNKIRSVGVTLNIAEFFKSDFQEEKAFYLDELYLKGSDLLEAERYADAEKVFGEISVLDPNFKDAGELKDVAYLEPRYHQGVVAKDAGKYREALNYLEQVIARKADYKDAVALKNEVLEKGKFTIAVLPFTNTTNASALDTRLSAYTLEALSRVNDPFLKVVDRENLQTILEEQRLGLSGVIDDQTAVSVGNIMGAKAIVTGTILSYTENKGRLRSATRNAFESYQVKKYNEQEQKHYYETAYKKTTYKEFYNDNSVSVSFQFKMISLSTGEVLATRIIEKEVKDEIRYATFDGNSTNLFPESNGNPNLSRAAKQELNQMISGRRELKAPGDMSNDLMQEVSRTLSTEIGNVLIETIR